MLLWTTFVYDPVTYWTWGAKGWLKNISCLRWINYSGYIPCGVGVIDYGGGGPIMIAAGFSSLAFTLILGKRLPGEHFTPHNMTLVWTGMGLLWFGWFGLNSASAIGAEPRAAMAGIVTMFSGATGAFIWSIMDFFQFGMFSGLSVCCGAIAGLIGITPASGFVSPWASLVIGCITSFICNLVYNIKLNSNHLDSLNTFALFGIGGFIGYILTGVFAQRWIGSLDGDWFWGGVIDKNARQLLFQLAGALMISVWSFLITGILLLAIDCIPTMNLRVKVEDELDGCDQGELGYGAYKIIPTSEMPVLKNNTIRKLKKPRNEIFKVKYGYKAKVIFIPINYIVGGRINSKF